MLNEKNNKKDIIAKTYKLRRKNVENFKHACELCEISQSEQLDTLIENFLTIFNSHFNSTMLNEKIEIKTVEDLIAFLQEFPSNMQVVLSINQEQFDLDNCTLQNCILQLGSKEINAIFNESFERINTTKSKLKNLANYL